MYIQDIPKTFERLENKVAEMENDLIKYCKNINLNTDVVRQKKHTINVFKDNLKILKSGVTELKIRILENEHELNDLRTLLKQKYDTII